MDANRSLAELTGPAALKLLASVPLGRIVFTRQALPAIRPVSHVLDGADIVIRSHHSAIISAERSGVVVAYETDAIDPGTWLGWVVTVTGTAWLVWEPADIARYERMLASWENGWRDQFIRITPHMISGYRLERVNGDAVAAGRGVS
jgi:hypothetical protein